MKKLLSILLILAMTALLPISASAAAAPGLSDAVYDSLDNEGLSYEEYASEVSWALQEKMYEEYKGGDKLPFWCWYDVNYDGLEELIVDNNHGKKGVETVSCKMLKGYGSKNIISKGDFSVYYWDHTNYKAVSLRVSSSNMFISVNPDGYIVASNAKGNTETFTIYDFNIWSDNLQVKTYTITYSGNKFKSITVKNSDGKYETVEEDWLTFLDLRNVLQRSTPLVFYQTS